MPESEKVFCGVGREGDQLRFSTVVFAPDDDGCSARCWTMNEWDRGVPFDVESYYRTIN